VTDAVVLEVVLDVRVLVDELPALDGDERGEVRDERVVVDVRHLIEESIFSPSTVWGLCLLPWLNAHSIVHSPWISQTALLSSYD